VPLPSRGGGLTAEQVGDHLDERDLIGPETARMDMPEALIAAYVELWNRHDLTGLDRMYETPTTTLRADGSMHVLPTDAAVRTFYDGALRAYEAEGYSTCAILDVSTIPAGRHAAVLQGTWAMYRLDGSEIRRWRQTYSLVRRPDGWRIFASIVHAPD
jgi:ketosteroid isomerase-like protein